MSSGDPLNQRETKAGTVLLVGDKGRKDLILNLREIPMPLSVTWITSPSFIAKAGKENLRAPDSKAFRRRLRDGLAKLYRIGRLLWGVLRENGLKNGYSGRVRAVWHWKRSLLERKKDSSASGWISFRRYCSRRARRESPEKKHIFFHISPRGQTLRLPDVLLDQLHGTVESV